MLNQPHIELISDEEATQRLRASDILPTLQRIQIARQMDLEAKKVFAKRLAGIEDRGSED